MHVGGYKTELITNADITALKYRHNAIIYENLEEFYYFEGYNHI